MKTNPKPELSTARLTWCEDMTFVASDNRGHAIVLDTKPEAGGNDSGIQPADLVMMAVAGCMAYDIVSILKKKRADLRRFTAEVEGERADDYPKRFLRLRMKFRANPEVKPADVQRAFELSRDKYCSVLHTLKNPPEFEFDVGTG
jgi:putative redox protein